MNPWLGLNKEMVYRPGDALTVEPPPRRVKPEPKRRIEVHPQIENPWGLTPVQCAVMTRYAEGLTAAEVGKALGLAEKTIETHLHDSRKRMGTDRRMKAVIAWDRFYRDQQQEKSHG